MKKRDGIVVAVDGPSGSGKSTIARLAARRLGFKYLDTGAMYRAVTLLALRNRLDMKDSEKLTQVARSMAFEFKDTGKEVRTLVNGEDVTDELRAPEVDRWVSLVSSHRQVREHLVQLQRIIGRDGELVCEGRDIGTVVFPDAQVKFFVTADPGERADRRKRQLGPAAEGITISEIEKEMERRDSDDSSREISPLRKAEDAVLIDTTKLTVEEEVNQVVEAVRRATARAS